MTTKPPPTLEAAKALFKGLKPWTKALLLAQIRIGALQRLAAHPEVPVGLLNDATDAVLNAFRYEVASTIISTIAHEGDKLEKLDPTFTTEKASSYTFAVCGKKILEDAPEVFDRAQLLLVHLADTYPHILFPSLPSKKDTP